MTSEPTNADLHLLRPHGAVAERVLCPGDPGRALRIAQDLTEGVPRMLNHHRGLWGYDGLAPDGRPLTVQGTGVGGPGAALVVADLLALGARRLVRVGTATAVDPALEPGTLVAAEWAVGADGTSRALARHWRLEPAGAPLAELARGADVVAPVASADHWPPLTEPAPAAPWPGAEPLDGPAELRSLAARAPVRDLQSAAFLAAAAAGGAAAAVVLVVARDARGDRLGDEALHAAELRAGRLALAALV